MANHRQELTLEARAFKCRFTHSHEFANIGRDQHHTTDLARRHEPWGDRPGNAGTRTVRTVEPILGIRQRLTLQGALVSRAPMGGKVGEQIIETLPNNWPVFKMMFGQPARTMCYEAYLTVEECDRHRRRIDDRTQLPALLFERLL